ncbi:ABC transporter substrate-binding protein [Variovorax sp. WS11]|uniref:ABC transporter substrate-binding protein n=1 Tax=Variovorax sp. WS11 TaxID=1105204 RepID=UPI000D0D71C8|nr:ABC transporter substrate-binding protein [Variovorax sp. WS11]NDZ16899.1 ABC transporter substrate-binding protein [Variovorax sp. WS11]PSL86267.1 ABC transporter substrate-binding protein [Variovorax sp. WS11]
MKRFAALALALLVSAGVQAQDIKIGGLLETSGFVASLGQPGLDGAMLAVEQVNAAGGINGRKVQFVNVNSESDNTKTVSAAKRLIEQEKVVAIVGPMSSGSSFAVVDTIEKARVPMISNGASRGIVLPPEQKKFTFLAPLTDVVVQTAMLKDMQAKGIKKIAILNSDVAFGTSGRDSLEKLAGDFGVQIVAKETFGNADTDISPQLTKIRGSDAQATVAWATGPGLAISTKNHRALGIKTPLYLAHSANDFNYLRLAGDSANGVLLPSSKLYVTASLPAGDAQKAVVEGFVRDYEKKYGKLPATFAGNGYDAAMLLMEAIRKAGTDPAAVRDAIEGTKSHVGVTAFYAYSPTDHFGTKPESVVMLTVKSGKFELATAQ